MIPILGVMVGAYIIMRCIEVFCFSQQRYTSPAAKLVMVFVAVAVAIVAGIASLALLAQG